MINQWKYKKAQKEYDTLQKAVQTEKSINWKKLKRMNKDIVAWIKVPGTKVSYPIVQGKDNSTYLHRTFHKKYNPSGCIQKWRRKLINEIINVKKISCQIIMLFMGII